MLRTQKQESKICGECPIAKTANLVGDTFALLMVRDLLNGPKRFGEIEKSLQGVSSRTIAKKLQFLESKNLIKKIFFKEKHPHAEYALTPHGKALHKIINSMKKYGEQYL
jgi:DNA-binding HxlR family transcriptional regulator